MIRITFWLILVLFPTSEAIASGCLSDARLASISGISVLARVPRYEPLPNLDPGQLETDIEACAKELLERQGFTVGDSDVHLYIKVDYSRILGNTLVLLVHLDVVEPAIVIRTAGEKRQTSKTVITWQRIELVESSSERTRDVILETVDGLVTDFYEAIIEARASGS